MLRFRSMFLLLFVAALSAAGCREKAATTSTSSTAPTSASPPAAASPAVAASPGAINPAAAMPSQLPKSLDAIPERLRRPLTLEEINQLPPETRDMILRAQGRLPAAGASPTASPKKN